MRREAHPGTFAAERQRVHLWQQTLTKELQKASGVRKDFQRETPEITQHTITPELRARADQLAREEEHLDFADRQGYSKLLSQLVNGEIT